MEVLIIVFAALAAISGAVLSFLSIGGVWKRSQSLGLWVLYVTVLFTVTLAFLYVQKRIWAAELEARTADVPVPQEKGRPKELRGLLRAGNDPTPRNPCSAYEEKGGMTVLFGSAGFTTPYPHQTLIQIDENDVVWFERTSDGMYINAVIQDEAGKEVARVTKNAVQVRDESGYYAEMPDPHTLFILTPNNEKALYVNYVNPRLMKVLGAFFHHGVGPYVIEEGKRPPGFTTDDLCMVIKTGPPSAIIQFTGQSVSQRYVPAASPSPSSSNAERAQG